ncbi:MULTISPECIES: SpoIIE family protein phosphatase [Cellulosimicrobium]|uniref:SpoIIE family protein phosphatase n=1 Tax=Cellulosimicrobium TaxID=157920 RepID=UPI001BAD3269|nr:MULTISPECIES: SpoIIE family protein phosphatase [Cellulosimicrobium]MCM3535128.1 SpoIIE family protein phosphatase [Cellulosimicrobium funkei]QUB99274.1 SpoIIE family protein phosphatase [Cellulosimicrobium cellulans]
MVASSAPSDPARAALAPAEAERLAAALERRAMSASEVSFTIADARAPGVPLVWVNPAFTATTGYAADEVLGTNCRFLQGPGTDRDAVARIRAAVDGGTTAGETLLNYRKDGTPFWNQLTLSPVHDELGTLTHFVGVQADVTARVETERSREAALDAAISANHRLTTTTRIVERLGELLGTEDVLAEAAQAVAEVFSCWAVVVTYPGGRSRTDVASHDPALADAARRLSRTPGWADRSLAAVDVLGGGARFARPFDVTPDLVSPHADEEELAAMHELGLGSAMSVGLRARGRIVGVLAVVSAQPGFFEDEDAVMFEDLGHRIGLLLDNARLYERERDAAHTLQERMLPRLGSLDGLDVAVVYRPAGGGSSVGAAAVGGDWFEAIELPDGRVLLVVGDVVGHDMHAAAAMGQIRSALLTVAADGTTPEEVVERLDGLVKRFGLADVATCVVATLGPPDADGGRELVYCRAGHPPPLLRTPDGAVRPLDESLTTPIGVVTPRPVTAARLRPRAGSVLVLYTDGLVESRARGQREGVAELARALGRAPADADAAAVRDHLLDQAGGRSDEDDTCLLVVRLPRGDEAAASDGGAPPHP